MASRTFAIDNGAHTIKAGFTDQDEPRIIPNCVTKAKSETRRRFIGDQVDDCKDMSSLFYILNFQKGYLVNWEMQKIVWDYVFGKEVFNVKFEDTCIIMTEPYFNFCSIQENMTEIFFEDYAAHSFCLVNGGTLCSYKYKEENAKELGCLVVDSGYSFTHVAPYVKGKRVKEAMRRIDIGGKALTNYLKDIISYRQLNVMDETYVVNQIKEELCYVSTDFWKDMAIAKKNLPDNTIWRDYILPDYTVIKRGFVRPPEQTSGKPLENEQLIKMNNERFTVPELLFHPSDIGIKQMGIPEAIVDSVKSLPKEVHPHMYKNIMLSGGNCQFPGFQERVLREVRALVPEFYEISVSSRGKPVVDAWHGAKAMQNSDDFKKRVITRQQYEENGVAYCVDIFNTK